jgi:hypothetical protein
MLLEEEFPSAFIFHSRVLGNLPLVHNSTLNNFQSSGNDCTPRSDRWIFLNPRNPHHHLSIFGRSRNG